jgi:hypothetical protein
VLDRTIYGNLLDAKKQNGAIVGDKRFLMNRKLKINYLYGGIYVTLVIISWVLFFKFILA